MYEAAPTRANRDVISENHQAFPVDNWSRIVEYTEDEWPTVWKIEDNTLRRENALVPGEVLFTYDLGEIDDTEEKFCVYTDVTRTLLALTSYRDLLYLLVKESYNGLEKFYLKCVKPIVDAYSKTYLEVYTDIELDLDYEVAQLSPLEDYPSGTYNIAMASDDISRMIVKMPDESIKIFKLHYDYVYFDKATGIMYFREDYNAEGLTISILE